jgi:predicted transglutaminase-like cysteine proteinase
MPFNYTRQQIPTGDVGTYATVEQMVHLIREGTMNERARLLAVDIIKGCPWKNKECEAKAIFKWLRSNIRFVSDPHMVELLHDVDAILRYRAADCDDFVILGASLLRSVGIPARVVIIGAVPQHPDAFTHTYLEIALPKRGWIGFDPSVVKSTFGWSPPKFTKKKVIEING